MKRLAILSLTMLWCFSSMAQHFSTLPKEKVDEIWIIAENKANSPSSYTEEAILKMLDYYGLTVSNLEKNQVPSSWRQSMYLNHINSEDKSKEICKLLLKVCNKHKELKSREIKTLKPYFQSYWFEQLQKEEIAAIQERERLEEERKNDLARNDWSKSNYWAKIQKFSKKDFTLNEKASHYYNFLQDNGIGVEKIKSAYFNSGISSSYDPLSAEVYNLAFESYGTYRSNIFKPTLYDAYITILKEIDWRVIEKNRVPRINQLEDAYGYKYDTAIYGPVFRADTYNVNRLKPVYEKVAELNRDMVWQTYVLCNLSEFQEEVDKWEQTLANCKEYPATGVIKDTILLGWDDEEKYYMQIPYINEDGVLVPHGKCSVRHVLPQLKNAKGSHFHAYTYDVTFVVNVENGMAKSIVPSGKVQKWEEDESAGGNVGLLSKAQAILNAKPIVKKTYNVKSVSDLNSPAFGYDAADKKTMIDNLSLCGKRGVSNHYHPDYDLYYIFDRQQLLRRYFERSSQNLILSRLQRMLVPIDMSELGIE